MEFGILSSFVIHIEVLELNNLTSKYFLKGGYLVSQKLRPETAPDDLYASQNSSHSNTFLSSLESYKLKFCQRKRAHSKGGNDVIYLTKCAKFYISGIAQGH